MWVESLYTSSLGIVLDGSARISNRIHPAYISILTSAHRKHVHLVVCLHSTFFFKELSPVQS